MLALNLLTSTDDGDGFFGAFGIGVTTLTSFTVGVIAVPTPITEIDWDGWLYHTFFDIRQGQTGMSNGSGYQKIEIDSKAMRKFDSQMVVYGALETTLVGVGSMRIHFDSRQLFLLS